MSTAIKDFETAYKRMCEIAGTYGEAYKARQLPATFKGRVTGVQINPPQVYGRAPNDEERAATKLIEDAKKVAEVREYGRGCLERDVILNTLADELDGIASSLTRLAAAAAVELNAEAAAMRVGKVREKTDGAD